MKTSSSVFRSLITLCGAVLGTMAHSLGLSTLRPNPSPASKLLVGKTSCILTPNRQAFASDSGGLLSLASGLLWHRATSTFNGRTPRTIGGNEIGLALAC